MKKCIALINIISILFTLQITQAKQVSKAGTTVAPFLNVDIGSRGFNVTVIERDSEVGGNLGKLSTLYPHNNAASDIIDRMKLEALALDKVKILTDSEVVDFEGYIGNFMATIKNNKSNDTKQT